MAVSAPLILSACVLSLGAAFGSPAEDNEVRSQIRLQGGTVELRWSPKKVFPSHRTNPPSITPDYAVRVSTDLKDWTMMAEKKGGMNVAAEPAPFVHSFPLTGAKGFYSVTAQVNLSGSDLGGLDLRNADLVRANLSGTRLSDSDLREADLSHANLRGASLTNANLTGAILLGTVMPDGRYQADDADAELLALKVSAQLLPPRALYLQMRDDLRAIRTSFPQVATIHSFPPWAPGEVLAKIPAEAVEQLSASDLGPASAGRTSLSGWTEVRFAQRYNAVVLTSVLHTRFGIREVEPNYAGGDGDDIFYDPLRKLYIFKRGQGDCPAGCIQRHFWEFTVEGQTVTLVREYEGMQAP